MIDESAVREVQSLLIMRSSLYPNQSFLPAEPSCFLAYVMYTTLWIYISERLDFYIIAEVQLQKTRVNFMLREDRKLKIPPAINLSEYHLFSLTKEVQFPVQFLITAQ